MIDRAEVTETVAELIDGYLDRMPGARRTSLTDAASGAAIGQLRHLLYLVDIALQDEQVPEAIRRRVMRTVLYAGAPSVAEGQARLDDIAARVAAAEALEPRRVALDDRLAQLDTLLGPYEGKGR